MTRLKSGVDFTKILCAAFTCAGPKSAKNTVKPSVFFALLGSVLVKASRKMLVKLILDLITCELYLKFFDKI